MITLLLLAALQDTQAERAVHRIVETKVQGALTSEYSGEYPFDYAGWTTLTAGEFAALSKEGKLDKELAKRLAGAFAQPREERKKDAKPDDPKTEDEIAEAAFEVKDGKLKGSFTITRKEGPGTRKIVAEISGTLEKGELVLAVTKSKVTGTWDWGGGIAELGGNLGRLEGLTRAPEATPTGKDRKDY